MYLTKKGIILRGKRGEIQTDNKKEKLKQREKLKNDADYFTEEEKANLFY